MSPVAEEAKCWSSLCHKPSYMYAIWTSDLPQLENTGYTQRGEQQALTQRPTRSLTVIVAVMPIVR